MDKKNKIIISILFAVFFLLAFTSPLNLPAGGWTQQFMPSIGSNVINDIVFLDSLIGFAIASRNVNPDTSSILKTTNGGDNWQVMFTQSSRRFSRVIFINSLTGFISGGSGTPYLYKTTDGGNNWNTIPGATLGNAYWNDMSVIGEDTIWLVDANGLNGGVFRTTNGGGNWERQFDGGTQNPNKIYMYNARIGFMSNSSASPNIYKTTNGGVSWAINLPNENFTDMYFVDSLIGWKCTNSSSQSGTIKKTNNGGLNWMIQNLPPESPPLSFSRMFKFSFVNKDTIWGIGGVYTFSGGQSRGVIYKTTNGGMNWGYQIPDTNINIYIYSTVQFVNKKIGWAYSPSMGGVHTTTGGDTITGIQPISNELPDVFELRQNYPNPFNSSSKIRFRISKTGKVSLQVFDITGRFINTLVEEELYTGEYEILFDASGLSSGVYFYQIIITNLKGGEVYRETKKMLMIK